MEFYFFFFVSYLWSSGSEAERVGSCNRHRGCVWAQGMAHLEPAGCEWRNPHEEYVHCRIVSMRKILSAVWCRKCVCLLHYSVMVHMKTQ
jgi:hypothetical protein